MAKATLWANNVTATVLYDVRKSIHVNTLKKTTRIMGRFNHTKKDLHFAKKKSSFIRKMQACTLELSPYSGQELLPHPLYSPNLWPSDYFRFPNLKICFGGENFAVTMRLLLKRLFFRCCSYCNFQRGYKLQKDIGIFAPNCEVTMLTNKINFIRKNVFSRSGAHRKTLGFQVSKYSGIISVMNYCIPVTVHMRFFFNILIILR